MSDNYNSFENGNNSQNQFENYNRQVISNKATNQHKQTQNNEKLKVWKPLVIGMVLASVVVGGISFYIIQQKNNQIDRLTKEKLELTQKSGVSKEASSQNNPTLKIQELIERKKGAFYLAEVDEIKEGNSYKTNNLCIGEFESSVVLLSGTCKTDGLVFDVKNTDMPQQLKTENGGCLSYVGSEKADSNDKFNDEGYTPLLTLKPCEISPKWQVVKPSPEYNLYNIKLYLPGKNYDVCVDLLDVKRVALQPIQLYRCHDLSMINNFANGSKDYHDTIFMAQSWYIDSTLK